MTLKTTRKLDHFRVGKLWYLYFVFLLGSGLIARRASSFMIRSTTSRAERVMSRVTKAHLLPSHHTSTVEVMSLVSKSASNCVTNELPSMLIVSSTVSNVLQDIQPEVGAEVLLDVSHLIVDFSAFFNNLSKDATSCMMQCREQQVIRSMVGRILVLCADWLPDHHIFPEEIAIQVFFLALGFLQISRVVSLDSHE